MEPKRFYRNGTDKVIAGVCTGLGEYFEMDPILVRLIFVVLALVGGGGVLLYIILWIVTPEKPILNPQILNSATMENQQSNTGSPQGSQVNPSSGNPMEPGKPERHRRGSLIGGLVLITLGVLFLADEFLPNVNFGDLWPVILIVIGIGLLINVVSGRRRQG
ncbi:MAG TPA: PspC domain-containing protein [Bacteroidales bacterium]|nr:PspC domain-containing protein [Bacteroidales bacterium]